MIQRDSVHLDKGCEGLVADSMKRQARHLGNYFHLGPGLRNHLRCLLVMVSVGSHVGGFGGCMENYLD